MILITIYVMEIEKFYKIKNPSAVLWDMDGVLVQNDHMWKDGYVTQTLINGHKWRDEDTKACRGKTGEDIAKHLSTIFPIDLALSIVANVEQGVVEGMDHSILGNHSLEVLDYYFSRSIPMAIVTSSVNAVVDKYVSLLSKDYFSLHITSADTPIGKPNPFGYQLASDKLGVNIKDCIVFEDSDTGIQAGINSGAHVIALPRNEQWVSGEKLDVVKDLQDFYNKFLS